MKSLNPNQKALSLKKEINSLEMRMIKYCDPIDAKIRDLQKEFEKSCIHNETEKKYEYESGSYYDRCKYINKIVCKLCGKIIKEDITTGYYG